MISEPQIIHRNSQFVVVEKPPLWLSVPGRFEDDRPILGTALQEILDARIWPIHRLDFEVSGVMIYALTADAHKRASALFEKQLIKKTYQAFSEPNVEPSPEKWLWKRKLLRGKKRSYESEHGDLAVTEAEIVDAPAGEWRLRPQTGKPHQLRVEMALQGHPIQGDSLYGSKIQWTTPGIALRAISLELPEDFAKQAELPARLSVPLFQEIKTK